MQLLQSNVATLSKNYLRNNLKLVNYIDMCIKSTCFRISCSASAWSYQSCQKLHKAKHTQS